MPKHPEGTKWVGYLFNREGYHGGGTPLFSVEEAYTFCLDNWRTSYEVRIVDPTEEYTELQAKDGMLICPMPDGTFKRLPCEGIEKALGAQL